MSYFNKRNLLFGGFIIAASLMIYAPLKELLDTASNREYYSHILLIPFVSVYLIYLKRKEIYLDKVYSFGVGAAVVLIGIILYVSGQTMGTGLNQNDFTSLITFSALVLLLGAFISAYGIRAFREALFPLLFLGFMIPIPSSLMDWIIHLLQVGSTEFTNILLTATGVPFFRNGFVFDMAGISVEVAKQCSGIRSSLALLITALLAGHLFLNTGWKKVILALSIFPIAMFKNGIRIVTLTLLGTYVDPRILQSSLHREGGIPFFIVALLLLAPVLYFLRKTEGQGFRGKGIGKEKGMGQDI
ncbi:MAG: exosortase [Proteobacteria bacterium]|nr:exosortase [Pseudomonadota bacterium]